MILRRLRIAASLFVPDVCYLCGAPAVDGEGPVCVACAMGFDRPAESPAALADTLRPRVMPRRAPFGTAAAPFVYTHTNGVGRLIRAGKYGDRPGLLTYLAARLAPMVPDDADVLMPVPMPWLKKLRRGYNQTEVIAAELSRITGVPVGDNLTARRHRSQASMRGAERRRAMQGVFRLRHADELEGLHVALVDDIITTGTTLYAAAETLLAASPGRLSALALAVTRQA